MEGSKRPADYAEVCPGYAYMIEHKGGNRNGYMGLFMRTINNTWPHADHIFLNLGRNGNSITTQSSHWCRQAIFARVLAFASRQECRSCGFIFANTDLHAVMVSYPMRLSTLSSWLNTRMAVGSLSSASFTSCDPSSLSKSTQQLLLWCPF